MDKETLDRLLPRDEFENMLAHAGKDIFVVASLTNLCGWASPLGYVDYSRAVPPNTSPVVDLLRWCRGWPSPLADNPGDIAADILGDRFSRGLG